MKRNVTFGTMGIALLLGIAFGVGAGWFMRRAASPMPEGPNVLIVSVDTLRADHLGCYGYPKPTSPVLDTFASESVVFESVFAQRSLTWPSLASIMTSQYPHQHGVREQGQPLRPDQTTIATVLDGLGYDTAAFTANCSGQGWRGFDHMEAFNVTVNLNPEAGDHAEAGGLLTDRLLAWLNRPRSRPFFAWAHYFAPHAAYEPPAEHHEPVATAYEGDLDGGLDTLNRIYGSEHALTEAEEAHLISLYDGEIRFMDYEFGRILSALDRLGVTDDTLIVFTSDHGEDLYERHQYFGHTPSVYDSSLHIPLLVRFPGATHAGTRVDAILESIDIAPTVLNAVDAPIPDTFRGEDATPLLTGERDRIRDFAVAEQWDAVLTLRSPSSRFVRNPNGAVVSWLSNTAGSYPVDIQELYLHETDPEEIANVAERHPDRVRRAQSQLDTWIADNDWKPNLGPLTPDELDPALQQELRALGYLN